MSYSREVLRAMVKARTQTDLAAAQPGAGPATGSEDVAQLVRSAIDDIDDTSLRAAAQALFPLPYEHPAAPLTERRRQAAACFFVTASTFRTAGPSAPSREDQVLDELARTLNARCPAQTGAATPIPAPRRRSPLRVALAAALVLPVIGALVLTRGDGGRNAVVQASDTTSPVPPRRATVIEATGGDIATVAPDRSTTTADEQPATSAATAPVAVFEPHHSSAVNLAPQSLETAKLPRLAESSGSAPAAPPKAAPRSTTNPDPQTAPAQAVDPSRITPMSKSKLESKSVATSPPATTTTTTTSTSAPPVPKVTDWSTTSSSTTTSAVAVPTRGEACPGVELSVDQARMNRVVAVLEALGRPSDICQNTAPETFSGLGFVDYLVAGDAAPWVEIGFTGGRSLVVPQSAWRAYRSAAEHLGGVSDSGLPARWTLADDGRSTLETSVGIVVTGERTDIKHHFLTEPFLSPWLANRERLGQPMGHSPPDGDDFQRGHIRIIGGRPAITTVSPQEARAMLPTDGELAGSIIRQPDGTSWYVDAQLRRWWIPDGGVWACLGGPDNVSADNVHGAAVASLAVAGRAGCGLR